MMTDEDRLEFATILAAVYDFYARELSDTALAIWWETLKPYDLATTREALSRHMRNPDVGQFIPKPADVVKEIGGTTVDAALLAWHKVCAALRSVGTYESIAFDDELVHRVVRDLGGWAWFGEQKIDEMPFIEKRFRDAYRAWARRAVVPAERVAYLPGRFELANGALGVKPEPPKLFGDTAVAAQIAGVKLIEGGIAT